MCLLQGVQACRGEVAIWPAMLGLCLASDQHDEVVVTDRVTDPAQGWHVGLDRTEEILVGLMCSLLVTGILWPRYAR